MQRTLQPIAAALAAGLLSGCLVGDQATGDPARTPAPEDVRSYHFTYTATIPAPAAGAEELRVWVPLPVDDPGVQEITHLTTTVNGDAAGGRRTRDPVFGNGILYTAVARPTGPTVIAWEADVKRFGDVGQGHLPTNPRYLQPNKLIPLDGEAATLAAKLGTKDGSLTREAAAKAIFDDVLDSMEYNKQVPGYGMGDYLRSLTVCKGNCTDFHARFIGTARASGIPCRFTMGIPMKKDAEGTYNSYHCWAHWYDGQDWRPVDISEADKIAADRPADAERFFGHLDPDRIAISCGRDLVLEPPQAGEPLNYFVFPYAEADGEAVTLDKESWVFTWKNL